MSVAPPPYNPNYEQKSASATTMYSNVSPPPPGWAPPVGGYPPPPPPNAGYQLHLFSGQSQQVPPPPPHAVYPTQPEGGYSGVGQQPPFVPHTGYAGGGYGRSNGVDIEWGGMPKEMNLSFNSKSIRQGFIRKVFMLLTCQLLFVTGLVVLFVFEPHVKAFASGYGVWLYMLSFLAFVVSYIVLICCPDVRRRFPGNIICLAVVTVTMGYMVAMIASFHKADVVVIALGITVLSCASIIIFAMQTKFDFTGCIAIIFVVTLALKFFVLFLILNAYVFPPGMFKILHVVYCGIAVVVFMIWLAIDVQMVIGGKRVEIDPEEYVFAATQLFLDIVYIFIYVLQIVGFASK